MAWCPKCKNEYRDGIKVCADCGCELVDKLVNQVALVMGNEQHIAAIKQFLEANHLKNVNVFYGKKEQMYLLMVDEKDKAAAQRMVTVFMDQQTKQQQQLEMQLRQREAIIRQQMEQAAQAQQPAEEPKAESNAAAQSGSNTYLNSAKRAEENRSSAWSLLIVGGIGMLVMILGMAGVLPFNVGNPYMFYGVMSAVFILFIVMGFVSMKNAKFFAKNVESENNLRNSLIEWGRENISASMVDEHIPMAEEMGEEDLYFRRYAIVKALMNHQFMNLDQGFLDKLIDEEIYDHIFPQ